MEENVCPQGYAYITIIDDCESAATALGPTYVGKVLIAPNIPKGCYWFANDKKLWFNEHATGAPDKDRKLVCKLISNKSILLCLY